MQGDPLSPFSFLFVSDALSALLSKSVAEGALKGVAICRGAPVISHLLFADDCIIFTQATKQAAERIQEILNIYNKGSGQLVNKSKSAIFFSSNSTDQMKEEVMHALDIRR